jgi:hypothetical protein
MVAEAAVLVLGLKIVAIAFAGTWFASTLFKIDRPICACLGVLYAYCGYTFVANTYINWLDLLIYMPFCVWAFKKFVTTGNFWIFSALMAACIYTSFSIACFAMLTVYPALIFYAIFYKKKEELFSFIAYLSLAFVCAVLMALPILVPSLIAYLKAGRGTGEFFSSMFYGFTTKGIDTEKYSIDLVLALGKPVEEVKIVDLPESGSTAYYHDENNVHYVPKRSVEDLIY